MNGCLSYKQSLRTVMIRKNSLLCKLIRIKTSSKSIFDSCMAKFQPELETCPVCRSTGNCHIHDYYNRTLIDFRSGRRTKSSLCLMRVFCDSCKHAHAVLPDVIIPYSSYSLLFILRLLGQYFTGRFTVEQLCERYLISRNQFYKWLALWMAHKQEWLGLLDNSETSDITFLKHMILTDSFSTLSLEFVLRFSRSFLQSHKNPVPAGLKTARYRQKVSAPDISIF